MFLFLGSTLLNETFAKRRSTKNLLLTIKVMKNKLW